MAQARVEAGRPPLAVIVAANIYAARRRLGWSQEKLARMAELSRETVRRIEDARDPARIGNWLRLDTLGRIASGLGADPAELLRWKPEATRVFLHGRPSLSLLASC